MASADFSADPNPDIGLACGPHLLFNGIELSQSVEPVWGAVSDLLRYRTIKRIIAFADAGHVKRSGLPIDKVSRAIVASGCLPAEWQDCVARHDGTMTGFDEEEDLRTHLQPLKMA